jgi:hypothetical protein
MMMMMMMMMALVNGKGKRYLVRELSATEPVSCLIVRVILSKLSNTTTTNFIYHRCREFQIIPNFTLLVCHYKLLLIPPSSVHFIH